MGNWNFTEELAPFTNLTWIHVDDISGPSAAIDEFVLRLGQAHGSGVHATLAGVVIAHCADDCGVAGCRDGRSGGA